MDGRTGRTKRRRADVSFHREPSLIAGYGKDEDAAFCTGLGSMFFGLSRHGSAGDPTPKAGAIQSGIYTKDVLKLAFFFLSFLFFSGVDSRGLL